MRLSRSVPLYLIVPIRSCHKTRIKWDGNEIGLGREKTGKEGKTLSVLYGDSREQSELCPLSFSPTHSKREGKEKMGMQIYNICTDSRQSL